MSDLLSHIDGLFVGMLDEEEQAELQRLVAAGKASIAYEGAAGFLGLGKVRVVSSAAALAGRRA